MNAKRAISYAFSTFCFAHTSPSTKIARIEEEAVKRSREFGKIIFVIVNGEGGDTNDSTRERLQQAGGSDCDYVVGTYDTFFDDDDNLRKKEGDVAENKNPNGFMIYDSELSIFDSKVKSATVQVSQRLADQQRLNLQKYGAGEIWLSFGSIDDRNDSIVNMVYDQVTVPPVSTSATTTFGTVPSTLATVKSIIADKSSSQRKILWYVASEAVRMKTRSAATIIIATSRRFAPQCSLSVPLSLL